jgi:hypothetical protein
MKGDLVTDSLSSLDRWRNHFSQLLSVDGIDDVRQTEIETAEPLVPEPSTFEVEMAIEELKRHKSQGIDQIPAELIKAGGRTICSGIHELTNCIFNKEELPEQWEQLIIVPVYKKGDKTDCRNYRGISLVSTMYKILSNILLARLTQ